MTVLGRLLAGEGPPVLQTCRFEGLGGQLYGREAVGDALKSLALGPARLDVETAWLGVWMDDDHAVVGDLVDGRFQRLWLLAETARLAPPPTVDLPADPDLTQGRREVRFDPRDHPELAAADVERLIQACEEWPLSAVVGPRPAILRAATIGSVAVALLRLNGKAVREPARPVDLNALVVTTADRCERRVDMAGCAQALARAWTPRL